MAALASLLAAFPAPRLSAATLAVSNPSFETPATPDDSFIVSDSAGPDGWSLYNSVPHIYRTFGVLNPNGTPLFNEPVPHGSNVGVTFLLETGVAEAGLEQTLADTLQPNTQYLLSVAVGNLADPPGSDMIDFNGFPGYRIELTAGGVMIAQDNNSLTPAEGEFLTSVILYTTGANPARMYEPLGIRLVNLNGPGVEVNFDDVRLTAVPEPSAYAAALGGAALAFAVANRRRRAR